MAGEVNPGINKGGKDGDQEAAKFTQEDVKKAIELLKVLGSRVDMIARAVRALGCNV